MIGKSAFTAFCLLIFSGISQADQSTVDSIQAAYQVSDSQQLEQLWQTSAGYDKFLAGFRLATVLHIKQKKKQAHDVLEQAISEMEAYLETNSTDAETWALLSHSYGLMVGFTFRGIVYGPKAAQALKKAMALAPKNPRVLLVAGAAKYNTPGMFGGDKKEAVRLLTDAIATFAYDVGVGHQWGLAESYVWRGIALQDLGEIEAAKSDWTKALEIAPDYGWPKYLLSSLDDK